jgi:hypothetical protein
VDSAVLAAVADAAAKVPTLANRLTRIKSALDEADRARPRWRHHKAPTSRAPWRPGIVHVGPHPFRAAAGEADRATPVSFFMIKLALAVLDGQGAPRRATPPCDSIRAAPRRAAPRRPASCVGCARKAHSGPAQPRVVGSARVQVARRHACHRLPGCRPVPARAPCSRPAARPLLRRRVRRTARRACGGRAGQALRGKSTERARQA